MGRIAENTYWKKNSRLSFLYEQWKEYKGANAFWGHAKEVEGYSYADVWEESQEERVRMTSNPLEEAEYYSEYYDVV